MTRPRRLLTQLFAAAFAVSLAGAASAQPSSSPEEIKIARQTAGDALAFYKTGEFEKALALFETARAVYPSAQIIRMTGYTLLALERWEKAAVTMEEALSTKVGPLAEADARDVTSQLAKATAHLALVTVSSKVKGAEAVIDGAPPRKLPMEPVRLLEGNHTITVHAKGFLDVTDEVTVPGGQPMDIPLDPEPKAKPVPVAVVAPPPPPPPPPKAKALIPHQQTLAVGLAAGGVASFGVALVTAIEAGHLRGNVAKDVAAHDQSYGQGCSQGDARLCAYDIAVTNHDANFADSLKNAAIGLDVLGAVLVAGGVVLYVTAPKNAAKDAPKERPADAGPVASVRCGLAGLGGVACSGAF